MLLRKKGGWEGHKDILEMMKFHYLDCGDGFMGVCIYPTYPVLYTKSVQCFVYTLYLNKSVFVFLKKRKHIEESKGHGGREGIECWEGVLCGTQSRPYRVKPLHPGAKLSNQID